MAYKLLHGDCLVLLKEIPDNSIDLILTDPPYIISRKSGFANCNENTSKECITKFGNYKTDFGDWDKNPLELEIILKLFFKKLKPNGSLIIFYDFWKMQELKETAEAIGFKQPRLGCWNKTNPVPVNSKLNYLTNSKEFFATFVKKSKPTFNSEYDSADYYIEDLTESETFFYPICHGKERTSHPTQKPLALIKELVLKHSNEDFVILDPFMGSGTTGVACLETNRNFIGIELDDDFFIIAENRIKNLM